MEGEGLARSISAEGEVLILLYYMKFYILLHIMHQLLQTFF